MYMLYDPIYGKELGYCHSYDCAVANVARLKFEDEDLAVYIKSVKQCNCEALPEITVEYDYQWSASDETAKEEGANIPDEGLYSPTEWNNLDCVQNGPLIEFEDIIENLRQTPYESLLRFSTAVTTTPAVKTKQNKNAKINLKPGRLELEESLFLNSK